MVSLSPSPISMGRKPAFTANQVLEAVQAWTLEHGVAPTIAELQRVLGIGSPRTVLRYLGTLENDGAIKRWPGARGLRVLRAPSSGTATRAVPLVGTAPAGPAMLAEENREGVVRLPVDYLSPPSARFFLLHVQGNSMNRARTAGGTIESGDLVLVRQQTTAESDEIVVALIDGEATIKRFVHGPHHSVLRPESSEVHEPIMVGPDFRVLGVIVRVLKKGAELLVGDQ